MAEDFNAAIGTILENNSKVIEDFISDRNLYESIQELTLLKNEKIRDLKEKYSQSNTSGDVGSDKDTNSNDDLADFISQFQPKFINSVTTKIKSLTLLGEHLFLDDRGFNYIEDEKSEGESLIKNITNKFIKNNNDKAISKKAKKTEYVSLRKLDAFLKEIEFPSFLDKILSEILINGSMVSVDCFDKEGNSYSAYPLRYVPIYKTNNCHKNSPDILLFYDDGFIRHNLVEKNNISSASEVDNDKKYLVLIDNSGIINPDENDTSIKKFYYQEIENDDFDYSEEWIEAEALDTCVFEHKINYNLKRGYGETFYKKSVFDLVKYTMSNYLLYKKLEEFSKTIIVSAGLDKGNRIPTAIINTNNSGLQAGEAFLDDFSKKNLLFLKEDPDEKNTTRFMEQDLSILDSITKTQEKIERDLLSSFGFPSDFLKEKPPSYNISTATSVMSNSEYATISYIKGKIENLITKYLNKILETKKSNKRIIFKINGLDVVTATMKDMNNYAKKQ